MAEKKAEKAEKTPTFSAAEKAAMKEYAAEKRRAASREKKEAKLAADAQAFADAVAALPEPDRTIAERFEAIVRAAAPDLLPRTMYGMPAFSDGQKVLVFLQPASKFGVRYATVGFQDNAALDDGPMWATSYAVLDIDDAVAARLDELVRRAVAGATVG